MSDVMFIPRSWPIYRMRGHFRIDPQNQIAHSSCLHFVRPSDTLPKRGAGCATSLSHWSCLMNYELVASFIHKVNVVVIALAIWLVTSVVFASNPIVTLVGTFDDLPYTPGYVAQGTVPDGYLGLNWDQLIYFEAATRNPTVGYLPATVSAPHVTANRFEHPVTITTPDSTQRFTFVGAYFGAGWNNGLQVEVDGYVNNILQNTRTVTANTTGSQWFEFDYPDINKLIISSSGGTAAFAPNFGSFTHFAMDNFTISIAVPEPGTFWLVAFGVLGGFSRARVREHRQHA
jgi:hypothetical protein